MEIRVSTAQLLDVLTMVQGIAHKKNTLPILSHVLLEATAENQLFLTATDLDIGVRLNAICSVQKPGRATLSAKGLLDLVKVLPGPDVVFTELSPALLQIKSGRTHAKLPTLSPDEFPQLPRIQEVVFYDMPSTLVRSMIEKTLYCTSQDENRYNLTGVYLEPSQDNSHRLSLVATDGHRLSKIEGLFEKALFASLKSCILPKKGLQELIRLLSDQEAAEDFKLGFLSNQAVMISKKGILTMRLIEGSFPDYRQVIPKISDKIIRCSRTDLLSSLKRVSVLSSDKSQCVKLSVKNGEMVVSFHNPEAGEIQDDIPIEYQGVPLDMGFNVRYMIEALASLEDQNVVLKLTDSLSPALILGMGQEHHSCVVMPMRLPQ